MTTFNQGGQRVTGNQFNVGGSGPVSVNKSYLVVTNVNLREFPPKLNWFWEFSEALDFANRHNPHHTVLCTQLPAYLSKIDK